MTIHRFRSLLASLFALCVILPALARADESPDAAKALVDQVAAFYQTNGRQATIDALGRADGPFVQGGLYAFAYDLTGTMIAHPKNPKLVGKNLIEVPDAEGKFFRKDIIATAKGKGDGWVDYLYKNPSTGQVEPKTTYLKRLDDLVVCAGSYRRK